MSRESEACREGSLLLWWVRSEEEARPQASRLEEGAPSPKTFRCKDGTQARRPCALSPLSPLLEFGNNLLPHGPPLHPCWLCPAYR